MAMPPRVLVHVPSTVSILLKVFSYTAGVLIPTLGGFHGYRYFRGLPLARAESKEGVEAQRLRDEIVFGDDAGKLNPP